MDFSLGPTIKEDLPGHWTTFMTTQGCGPNPCASSYSRELNLTMHEWERLCARSRDSLSSMIYVTKSLGSSWFQLSLLPHWYSSEYSYFALGNHIEEESSHSSNIGEEGWVIWTAQRKKDSRNWQSRWWEFFSCFFLSLYFYSEHLWERSKLKTFSEERAKLKLDPCSELFPVLVVL